MKKSKTTEIKTNTHKDIEVIKGIRYISVTTVLTIIRKPGLEKWRGFVGNDEADRKMKEGADKGTDGHKGFHFINEGELTKAKRMKVLPEVKRAIMRYADWDFENVKKNIFSEKQFYSQKNRFMGRPDRLVEMNDGKIALLDHKTGKVIDKTDKWQCAAYKYLIEENGYKVDDIYILHNSVSADELKVIKIPRNKHLQYFNDFLYTKRIYIDYNYN